MAVIYFRDSLIITGMLIVNTVVVRAITLCNTATPDWIQNTVSFMGSNRVGQVFLTKHLFEQVSQRVTPFFSNLDMYFE